MNAMTRNDLQAALTLREFQIDYTTRQPGLVWTIVDGIPRIHAWWDDNVLHLDVTDRWLCPLYTLTFTANTPLDVIERTVDGLITDAFDDLGEDE